MAELVERYVHQVGRYLPPKERAEIEAELRSMIEDQLDDRYAGSPSPEDVMAVLAEFGRPNEMAASYNRDQYLIGPDVYPYLMMTLRHVWAVVPTIVIFLNLFAALTSERQGSWLDTIFATLVGVVQVTLSFSALVVLLFSFIERIRPHLDNEETAFDPLTLPKVDDPRIVDQFETVAGIAIGSFFTLLFSYWLYAGGLTLRFNLLEPGEVIPSPLSWLVLLIASVGAQVIVHALALWRSRWSARLWLAGTILEVFGLFCLYFAVLSPGFARLITNNPSLGGVLGSAPEIITVGLGLMTLLGRGAGLVRLWSYADGSPAPVIARTDA